MTDTETLLIMHGQREAKRKAKLQQQYESNKCQDVSLTDLDMFIDSFSSDTLAASPRGTLLINHTIGEGTKWYRHRGAQ